MSSFHSEFMTIGEKHRVEYSCRDGFPLEEVWDRARSMCYIIDQVSKAARLVKIFSDCRHGIINFFVATTNESEIPELERVLEVGTTLQDGQSVVLLKLLPEPKHMHSDSYNHAEYLHRNTP